MDEKRVPTSFKEYLELEGERRAYEAAAKRVEQLVGSETYMQAFRKAAKTIRAMKPEEAK